MNIKSIFTSLLPGKKLGNSPSVKKATVVINVITALAIAASHAGIISLDPEQINTISGNIGSLIETLSPYVVLVINAYTHIATTESIGLKK